MPKPLPPGLEVRQARPEDIPSLADLLVTAPDDGATYQFPHILEYPDEMKEMHRGWSEAGIKDAETLMRLAVVGDKVVGFSSWSRKVDGKTVPIERDSPNETISQTPKESPSGTKPKSRALERDAKHCAAVKRSRGKTTSPSETVSCYVLTGLAIRDSYQGHGLGTLLVRWGLDKAASENVAVFATGEERGVSFYVHALGFKTVAGSEYWLDSDGNDITREQVEQGNESWKKANGGLSGAEIVWYPEGTLGE